MDDVCLSITFLLGADGIVRGLMGLDVADTRTWAEGFVHRLIAFFAGTYYRRRSGWGHPATLSLSRLRTLSPDQPPAQVAGGIQPKWLGAFSHSFIKWVKGIEIINFLPCPIKS